jgi:hypothetical protein
MRSAGKKYQFHQISLITQDFFAKIDSGAWAVAAEKRITRAAAPFIRISRLRRTG